MNRSYPERRYFPAKRCIGGEVGRENTKRITEENNARVGVYPTTTTKRTNMKPCKENLKIEGRGDAGVWNLTLDRAPEEAI